MQAEEKRKFDPVFQKDLMQMLWDPEVADSPYMFVMTVYPWGQPGTPLEKYKGPRAWQREDLEELGDHIKSNQRLVAEGKTPLPFRKSTVSGRGVGKSASVAWQVHWLQSCAPGATSQISANTEEQLKSRTMAEVKKWFTLGLNSTWFDMSTMAVYPRTWYGDLIKSQLQIDTGYYYARAVLWSEENPDAFAGTHNPLGMQLVFDEASGIVRPIWTVSEGFFTEPDLHRYWVCYSNGRRNTGAFYDTHRGLTPWPRTRQLDSRTVEGIDHSVLEGIITTFGVDSDEARVEVYGQFPDSSDDQFIAHSLIDDSARRPLPPFDSGAAVVLGVDVARGGKASSVIYPRVGRDARGEPYRQYKGLNTISLAHKIAKAIDDYRPDAVNIDAGQGAGVIDYLRDVLKYRNINEIWFNAKPVDAERWGNKRIEMYADLRTDMQRGLCIPDDPVLKRDLAALKKTQPKKRDVWYLEPKEFDGQCDVSDALALTYALPVSRRDLSVRKRRVVPVPGVDYNVYSRDYR